MALPVSTEERRFMRRLQWGLLVGCLCCVGYCAWGIWAGEIGLGGRYGGAQTRLRSEAPAAFWLIWSLWAALSVFLAYACWWLQRGMNRSSD